MSTMPAVLDPALAELIDRVADRQRLDFGHMASEAKPDGSLITACDRWSDAAIVAGLSSLCPGEGVLSEEGQQRVPTTQAYWVVDPLDGTTNFAAGIPYWAISVARFEGGVPVLAILDVPPLRQRIVAVRGQGPGATASLSSPPGCMPIQPAALRSAVARSVCCRNFPTGASLERSVFWGWPASIW